MQAIVERQANPDAHPGKLITERCGWHRASAAVAILCAVMVLFAATLRLSHSHTPAEQESGHCPICVAIHTGMPAATLPVQVILHAAPEPIVAASPIAQAKTWVESLSDRAPPALA